jgi:hypothetical protein
MEWRLWLARRGWLSGDPFDYAQDRLFAPLKCVSLRMTESYNPKLSC